MFDVSVNYKRIFRHKVVKSCRYVYSESCQCTNDADKQNLISYTEAKKKNIYKKYKNKNLRVNKKQPLQQNSVIEGKKKNENQIFRKIIEQQNEKENLLGF